jgi:hypothetical protein
MPQRIVISEYDENGNSSVGESAVNAVAVTPNDGADLASGYTKGIYVGGTGDVSVVMNNGGAVTFTGLAAGVVHKLSVKRVNSTGTTATGIIALY